MNKQQHWEEITTLLANIDKYERFTENTTDQELIHFNRLKIQYYKSEIKKKIDYLLLILK